MVPFGLVFLVMLTPSAIGGQDLAALIARQPAAGAGERARNHVIASPFGTIHAANFSMPRPRGAAMPASLSYALAGLDTSNADITGSIRERMLRDVVVEPGVPASVPTVERRLKGDRLIASPVQNADTEQVVQQGAQQPAPAQEQSGVAALAHEELQAEATASPQQERAVEGVTLAARQPDEEIPPVGYSLASLDPVARDTRAGMTAVPVENPDAVTPAAKADRLAPSSEAGLPSDLPPGHRGADRAWHRYTR